MSSKYPRRVLLALLLLLPAAPLLIPTTRARILAWARGEPIASDGRPLSYHVQRLRDLPPGDPQREVTVIAIGLIGPPAAEAVPAVVDVLRNDPEPRNRLWAAQTLQKIRSPEAVPALVEALRDEIPAVIVEARRSLHVLDKEALKKALVEHLRDERWWVREGAAEGLGEFGPDAKEFTLLLDETLRDPHCIVRETAQKALSRINPSSNP